ncbi:hypothetical protein [Rhodovarius lipocyclicus]|uniref:hypothetical protein n=1 Tax=Rhodovarius lipocyclicus TaxID=268410 RepID=UPI001359B4ED|nr:hypothetical protein [Rhodovarius lipocyclicus]
MARKWLRSTAARRSPDLAFDAAQVLGHSVDVSIRHYTEASSLHATCAAHGSASMVRELRELENRCETLGHDVMAAGEVELAPVLPSKLLRLYRRRVERLEQDLLDPELNALATEALRLLVDSILVFPGENQGQVEISLRGDLAVFLHAGAHLAL